MRPASRFPVCPKPTPLESLTSWLTRIAGYYRISIDDLFLIGFELEKPKSWWDIDAKPSETLISRIAERTGFASQIINNMTLRSYVPDVLVGLEPTDEDTVLRYTHAFSILGKEPDKGCFYNRESTYQPWMRYLPWRNQREWRQFCPRCVQEKKSPQPLFWRTVIVSTCPKHKCFLVEENGIAWDASPKALPVNEAGPLLVWLDEITTDALQTGMAKLWDERIPLPVWCRFLRTMQRELVLRSFPDEIFSKMHTEIWRNAGTKPARGQRLERLSHEKRTIVVHCLAHLLHDWPERLVTAMCLPRRFASRRLPFFIARHLDFVPTWYGIFLNDEKFAYDVILHECKYMYGQSPSLAEMLNALLITFRWRRSIQQRLEEFGAIDHQKAIDEEMSCERRHTASQNVLRCGASDARELASLNLQIHSESFSQAGEQDRREWAVCSEPSC